MNRNEAEALSMVAPGVAVEVEEKEKLPPMGTLDDFIERWRERNKMADPDVKSSTVLLADRDDDPTRAGGVVMTEDEDHLPMIRTALDLLCSALALRYPAIAAVELPADLSPRRLVPREAMIARLLEVGRWSDEDVRQLFGV